MNKSAELSGSSLRNIPHRHQRKHDLIAQLRYERRYGGSRRPSYLGNVDHDVVVGHAGHPEEPLLDDPLALHLHVGHRRPGRQEQGRGARAAVLLLLLPEAGDLLRGHGDGLRDRRGGTDGGERESWQQKRERQWRNGTDGRRRRRQRLNNRINHLLKVCGCLPRSGRLPVLLSAAVA